MALVSYAVSDASDSEEDSPEKLTPKIVESKTALVIEEDEVDKQNDDGDKLFSVLPTPKSAYSLFDGDLSRKLLLNKEMNTKSTVSGKKAVRIAVPSLSDFDEDLPRPTTKVIHSSKKSSLFDILPPPKNSTASTAKKLIPDSVKKSLTAINPIPKLPPKPAPTMKPARVQEVEDSDSGDESSDFLGLNKPQNSDLPPLQNEVMPVDWKDTPPLPSPPKINEIAEDIEEPNSTQPNFVPFSNDGLELDEEALQRLCGGSKRRRTNVQPQLIDVAEADVAPDRQEWLVKQLTEEKVMKSHSHRKNAGPSSQQRRKHQITYLAFQAKEQEQELQNQWASNRMTKKQTQSKYGF